MICLPSGENCGDMMRRGLYAFDVMRRSPIKGSGCGLPVHVVFIKPRDRSLYTIVSPSAFAVGVNALPLDLTSRKLASLVLTEPSFHAVTPGVLKQNPRKQNCLPSLIDSLYEKTSSESSGLQSGERGSFVPNSIRSLLPSGFMVMMPGTGPCRANAICVPA